MDQLLDEFEALGRINSLIMTYRQKAPDSQAVSQPAMDDYLNRHLSEQDWLLWKRLQRNLSEDRVMNKDVPVSQTITGPQLKRLFNQYKRAGYERFACWAQSLVPPLTDRLD